MIPDDLSWKTLKVSDCSADISSVAPCVSDSLWYGHSLSTVNLSQVQWDPGSQKRAHLGLIDATQGTLAA